MFGNILLLKLAKGNPRFGMHSLTSVGAAPIAWWSRVLQLVSRCISSLQQFIILP